MVEVTVKPEEGTADFSIQEGCPVCLGTLDVRMQAGLSWGYCSQCHWLARKQVFMGSNTLRVTHLPGGLA